jgi:hypothetical protein
MGRHEETPFCLNPDSSYVLRKLFQVFYGIVTTVPGKGACWNAFTSLHYNHFLSSMFLWFLGAHLLIRSVCLVLGGNFHPWFNAHVTAEKNLRLVQLLLPSPTGRSPRLWTMPETMMSGSYRKYWTYASVMFGVLAKFNTWFLEACSVNLEGTCWDFLPAKISPRFAQHPPLYVEMLVDLYCFLTESCKMGATIRTVT